MRDPEQLALHGEKTQIYALFTDLEGFTKLSHAITPEQLSTLLNRYLDLLSDVVLDHGGTIDKFVGDAVVAFWGAPIARPDDADRAVRAGDRDVRGRARNSAPHRRRRHAADRLHPRRPPSRRGGGRQFRRRGPDPVYRARRRHEHARRGSNRPTRR